MTKAGETLIRAGRKAALRSIEKQAALDADPAIGAARNGVLPGQWKAGKDGLPEDIPVYPLGVSDDIYWFLDPLGYVRAIADDKLGGKAKLNSLFRTRTRYLTWAWPKWVASKKDGEPPKVSGVSTDDASRVLIDACGFKGHFDNVNLVRGRGAWVDSYNSLIWHAGESLWRLEGKRIVEQPLGELDRHIYARRGATFAPFSEPVNDALNPGPAVLNHIRAWNWERPDIDPVLMLGYIGVALLGGALPWRPHMFMTGDRGMGKSTLQKFIRSIMQNALIEAEDTTPAGIYQRVAHDSLPVMLDEVESEAGSRRGQDIIKLARLASSGGLMLRGGQNHVGAEFRAQSSFFFSGINAPAARGQDLSRVVFVRVRPLDPKARLPKFALEPSLVGPLLLRILFQAWPRFEDTFSRYRAMLAEDRRDPREQDTMGMLLTMADMILGPEIMDDIGLPDSGNPQWLSLLGEAERAEPNWERCLRHILSVQPPAWRQGEKYTSVGQVLYKYLANQDSDLTFESVNAKLEKCGLKLLPCVKDGDGRVVIDAEVLAIPNYTQPLAELFAGTDWEGHGGTGIWKEALRQGPADMIATGKTINKHRIAGQQQRCTLVMIKDFLEV